MFSKRRVKIVSLPSQRNANVYVHQYRFHIIYDTFASKAFLTFKNIMCKYLNTERFEIDI